jgi:murein L,D-transpeptidase YcbB/YkuD
MLFYFSPLLILLFNVLTVKLTCAKNHPELNAYLIKYSEIKKNGGWPHIKFNRVLKRGDINSGINLIRKRLIISGDHKLISLTCDTFNLNLEEGVKRFQYRHNLKVDGIIGIKTITAMNVPVERRIKEIETNLKRWKSFKVPADTFIFVNIAAQDLALLYHDSVILKMKIIVGRETRKTQEFTAWLNEIEINPHWIVPPGIINLDILPKLKEDCKFTESEKINVYLNHALLNPCNVYWDSITDASSYVFVQEPGETNPMGKIKFNFPNPHFIYFHDTPAKNLFEKETRTFSSGCIRLFDARNLAVLLLKKDRAWNDSKLDSLIKSKENIKIPLHTAVAVSINYFTAWVDKQGLLMFASDIYKLD